MKTTYIIQRALLQKDLN